MAAGDTIFSRLLGTLKTSFRIAKATFDASGLTAARAITVPDCPGKLVVQNAVVLGTTGAVSLDLKTGRDFEITPTGNVTLSFANDFDGVAFVLRVIGSAFTITWPSGITWSTGGAPTLPTSGRITVGFKRKASGDYDGFVSASTTAPAPTSVSSVPTSGTLNQLSFHTVSQVLYIWDGTSACALSPQASRTASDLTNATVTMASLTGLSADLVAGRKYAGTLTLRLSNTTAADGAAFDFNGGTATITSFWAAGVLATGVSGATGPTMGTTESTTLAGAISYTSLGTTGTDYIEIDFELVCNASGTFIPRFAENLHVTGTLTVKTGSSLELKDTP